MHIENPEKLLKRPIIGRDGQMWIVNECDLLLDAERNGPTYEFHFITDVPVKSSPNQTYYHMTKALRAKAELTLFRHQHENIFELECNGAVVHGYLKDINTVDKFIIKIVDMLPVCY
jgi:hypothetical protein